MTAPTISVEGSGHECDIKIDTWLRDILTQTPGVVRAVAKREMLLACREFYTESLSWRVVIGPKDRKANKRRYVMSPYDAYANIVRVIGVEMDGLPLNQLFRRPGEATRTQNQPSGYWLESPDIISLHPTPTEAKEDCLTFYVALVPKMTTTHLPAISMSQHYDALLDGVLGRLMSHPAKPYSNPTLGQYHMQRFRSAIGKHAGLAKEGYAGSPQWRFPRFGK